MAIFWPAIKNTKNSRQVKFRSSNMVKRVEDLLFKIDDKLPKGIELIYEYVNNDIKTIKIELIIDYEKIKLSSYYGLEFKNVNYFMSNYSAFGIDTNSRSFWFVENVSVVRNDNFEKIAYTLKLDEWTTFYSNIKNLKGYVELKESHTNRWQRGENRKNYPNLINNPFMNNCNDFCSDFNTKQEFLQPQQLYDTKHIGFDLKVNELSKEFFEIDENNVVTKQIRGWILLWCDKTESGEFDISLIGVIANPLKLFMYPIFDEFNQNNWLNGLKKIQETKYRIVISNMIGDIFAYEELQKTDFEGWYESSTNNFKTSQTNGIMESHNNFIEKFEYSNEDIIASIREPHLHALNHTHYELSNVQKTSVIFDLNRLIKNRGLIQKPSLEEKVDEPLIDNPDIKIINFFSKKPIKSLYYSVTGKKNMYFTNNENEAMILEIKHDEEITLKYIFENASFINKLSWADGIRGSNCGSWHTQFKNWIDVRNNGTPNEIIKNAILKNVPANSITNYTDIDPISSMTYRKASITTGNSSTGSYCNYDFSSPVIVKDTIWPFYFTKLSIGNYNLRTGYKASELENAGPYNQSVIGYNITGYINGKYQAINWYVVYNNKIYEFPIGKLIPSQYTIGSSNNFWYDDNVVVLTKNIGFFSPEEMGLKNVLLDTDTTLTNKVNNNTMTLNVKGSYVYPFVSEAYIEFLKTSINSLRTGISNADAKLAQGLSQAVVKAGLGVAGGIGAGATLGGPLGAILGGLGGLLNVPNVLMNMDKMKLDAQMTKNTISAQINDAKNLQDNISVTGASSTLTDTVLREFIDTKSMFQNYWNFWMPSVHKLELNPIDKESVKYYFNKNGYKQDRYLKIDTMKDLYNRWAFDKIRLANIDELIESNGYSKVLFSNMIEDMLQGIWVWDIDKVDYEDILNYTINNYENYIWEEAFNSQVGLLDMKLDEGLS